MSSHFRAASAPENPPGLDTHLPFLFDGRPPSRPAPLEAGVPAEAAPIVVVHSVSRWLPQTATWLFNEVRYLPAPVESHVVCETALNLDQFPIPRLHSLRDESRLRFTWDRGLRRLGVRAHLGGLEARARGVGADVVHSHFGNVGWADLAAARRAGCRQVVTFYGLDVDFLPRSDPRWYVRYREMFARVDRVLCEGPFMARAVVQLGCPPEKVRVHHLGVSVGEIPFRPRTWRPGEPLRVLLAATFREKKGLPYGLEALARIKDDLPLEITVIGDAPDDARSRAEKQRILDTVARGGLASRTRLLGYRPHAEFLDEAYRHHVFLSPSVTASDGDSEGGAPVGLIEMAASGMPVVSTTHCDIPEVIVPGTTGLLAPERDVDALAGYLRWLAAHPGAWPRMLVAGRRRIEEEFNAAEQGRRLAAIYAEVTQGASPNPSGALARPPSPGP